MSKMRYPVLDALRGLAVILMIIFHATYDLSLFRLIDLNVRVGFWYALPRFIVFLFLWCVGASLELTHGQSIKWPSYWQRLRKLTGLAIVISAVTYVLFPQSWVYFGTLHCIAGVTLMALPFFFFRWARWPALIAILVAQYILGYGIAWVGTLFPHYSMDFIPAYPWFWVTLLGMITGPTVLAKLPRAFPGQQILIWPGTHALKIYLLHQPLLYGLCYLAVMLLGK